MYHNPNPHSQVQNMKKKHRSSLQMKGSTVCIASGANIPTYKNYTFMHYFLSTQIWKISELNN